MDKLFYFDSVTGRCVTYGNLIADLNSTSQLCRIIKTLDYYEIYKSIVVSMLAGDQITLVDGEFTDNEVEAMAGGETAAELNAASPVSYKPLTSLDDLQERIAATSDSWRMSLFTSGTTGRPKKVSHSQSTICRNVKRGERHASDVWGMAYNPTHMAGIQVFFQALLNGNSMIRLFGVAKEDIFALIDKYAISHLSATPTFYRMLLPTEARCGSVVRLTSGGEKFDDRTLRQLTACFPNAKFTNVYASTEAGSILASKDDVFIVKDTTEGKVKIENCELLLHRSLLGQSSSFVLDGEWYHTGDIVHIETESPLTFKIASRKSELINVGGYKVNPTEVEDMIRQCPGVKDVRIYAKNNRILGNIICCEVVNFDEADVKESDIRQFLQSRIQEYKIPRMIKFVSHINVTKTGKASRT